MCSCPLPFLLLQILPSLYFLDTMKWGAFFYCALLLWDSRLETASHGLDLLKPWPKLNLFSLHCICQIFCPSKERWLRQDSHTSGKLLITLRKTTKACWATSCCSGCSVHFRAVNTYTSTTRFTSPREFLVSFYSLKASAEQMHRVEYVKAQPSKQFSVNKMGSGFKFHPRGVELGKSRKGTVAQHQCVWPGRHSCFRRTHTKFKPLQVSYLLYPVFDFSKHCMFDQLPRVPPQEGKKLQTHQINSTGNWMEI